ncbi:uncharacterized protein TNCV_2960371 [Trichonephila clavipes]|nr:uncharacterized protein TNCV_2960371 [Trichonephila clavipes]
MLQDYDTSFSRVYFSRPPVFFSTALFSLPFRPFSPPSLPDPFLYIVSRSTCCQVLGPVDPRDVLYTKTRLRTPSTDHLSRRPPYRKKCVLIANCFIGRHPSTGRTFIRDPCVFSNHTKAPCSRTLGIAAPITCAALDAHPLSGATREKTGLQRSGNRSSLATNPGSISAVMTIVFLCGDPVVNASVLPLLYSNLPFPQLVRWYGVPLPTTHGHL